MPKFFVNKNDINQNEIVIKGEDAKHISQVLRYKIGDTLEVGNGVGIDYITKIEKVCKKEIVLKVIDEKKSIAEPKVKVTLFQCLPKGSKMELIIQKCVELGVYEIIPFVSEFSVVKLNDKVDRKIERYQKISETASKQCRRGIIPKIYNPITLDEALALSKDFDLSLIAYENEKDITIKKISEKENVNSVCVFVGSEGGFSNMEIEEAKKYGVIPVTLGNRILRTETAGLVLTNLLVYEFDK